MDAFLVAAMAGATLAPDYRDVCGAAAPAAKFAPRLILYPRATSRSDGGKQAVRQGTPRAEGGARQRH
ncbi:MAG TPA: hypothetical protein VNU48_06995, partial [Burkholderiaceae bacterium]|nr:hypothetical protein [Burkholderiaceae bacterium]